MFAALPIALGLAGTLALSDRNEVRLRVPGTLNKGVSLDLETTPEARLTLASHRMRYTLAYGPTGTLWDVGQSSFRATLLHEGTASVDWFAPRTQLSLRETARYGSIDFSSAALTSTQPGQPPRLDVIPSPQVIPFGSSQTTLASHLTLERWTLDSSVGYQLSGGVTEQARAALPFQRGGFGQLRGEYRVTHRDFAATTFDASRTSFSSGPEATLTEIDERWRHLISPVTTGELTLGASLSRFRPARNASYSFEGHPVAEAALDHRLALGTGRLELRYSVGVSPIVNQLDGTVDERLRGTVAATHTYKHFTSRALLTASESMPPNRSDATRLFAGEIGTTWTPRGVVGFDAGMRGFYQRTETTGADFFQATFFVGVTFRANPVRF